MQEYAILSTMTDDQDKIAQIDLNLRERGQEVERLRAINMALQEKILRIEEELGVVYDALDFAIDGINAIKDAELTSDQIDSFTEKVNSWRVPVEIQEEPLEDA